jgi:hypothetical protein
MLKTEIKYIQQRVSNMFLIFLRKKKSPISEQFLITAGFLFILLWIYWGAWSDIRLNTMENDSLLSRLGAPILWWQVVILCVFYFVLQLLNKLKSIQAIVQKRSKLIDFVLFFLIWGITAWIWVSQPTLSQYSIRMPTPPNYEYYPFSDSALYNASSQRFITGYPYYENIIDKPLLIVYQVILDLAGGQSPNLSFTLNTVFLSVLPALLYLLGKCLNNRRLGIGLALLMVFKEINSLQITSHVYMTSNVKTMLSEVPTGIFISIAAIFIILWTKNPRKYLWAILSGGLIGLSSLVRLNSLILLPIGPICTFLVGKKIDKQWLLRVAVFSGSFLITLSPWLIYNQSVYNNPLTFFNRKTFGVVVDHRYEPFMITGKEAIDTIPSTKPAQVGSHSFAKYSSLVLYMFDRFSINLLTTIITTAPRFRDNYQTMFTHNYWSYLSFTDIEGFFSLTINFLIISIGIGYSWIRWKFAGLVPLFTNLAYGLGCAISLTAAGFRSIVPVEWVVLIYFCIGIWVIIDLLLRDHEFTKEEGPILHTQDKWGKCLSWLFFVVIIAAAPVSITKIFPRQELTEKDEAIQILSKIPTKDPIVTEIIKNDIQKFNYGYGIAISPRYYGINQGDNTETPEKFLVRPYSRIDFEFFQFPGRDPVTRRYYGFPTIEVPISNAPQYFPNKSKVMVFSCSIKGADIPVLVAVLGKNQVIYRNNLIDATDLNSCTD